MPERSIMSMRSVVWLIVAGFISFAAIALMAAFEDWFTPPGNARANSYSRSVIGHAALVETLRELGIPVERSRSHSFKKGDDGGVLVVAEPLLRLTTSAVVKNLRSVPRALLVLPKHTGTPNRKKPEWLARIFEVPLSQPQRLIDQVLDDVKITRRQFAQYWAKNLIGPVPTLDDPQLMLSQTLTPIISVSGQSGILLGELQRGDNRLWILSDPDILSNYGLGRGENADLIVTILQSLRNREGPIRIDETLHGFRLTPNFWAAMVTLPFVVPTILGFATVLVLLWAALGRFGTPQKLQPAIAPGKETLIENTANLLQHSDQAGEILRAYCDITVKEVADRLHAPSSLSQDDLLEWLGRVGRTGNGNMSPRALHDRVIEGPPSRGRKSAWNIRLANQIYRWKQGMLNES